MSIHAGKLYTGTSGFQYEHWRTVFYPQNLARNRWFDYYARFFDTVEINNSFYRLPRVETFDAWRQQACAGFVYALKFSRYGSHLKRLKDPHATIAQFLKRAVHLEAHLGPILVQLPPRWNLNIARLAAFLEFAPKRFRWAFEFRDPSWLSEPVFALLEEHGAALCVHDMLEGHPERVTADWMYWRFHGDHYAGRYSAPFLRIKARRMRDYLSEGKDVYVYFNNDAQAHAVQNALELKDYLHAA